MEARQILAVNMRRIRKAKGMKQDDLAELSGLHRTYIGSIEQQRLNVSLANIEKIANALDVSCAELLTEEHPSTEVILDASGNVVHMSDYALCDFSNDEIEISPLSMADPDLGTQILISLIQRGITEPTELTKEYKKTEKALLSYLQSGLAVTDE